ncbi:MAG: hypothetical protein ACOX42_06055 [Clostridia bacterium]|jgi:predicted DNA-binding transcriptional regulator YafY
MPDRMWRIALETGRRLTIIYNRNGSITQRRIKVIGVDDHHILAYCYLRNRIRTFRKDNVLAVTYSETKSA